MSMTMSRRLVLGHRDLDVERGVNLMSVKYKKAIMKIDYLGDDVGKLLTTSLNPGQGGEFPFCPSPDECTDDDCPYDATSSSLSAL